MAALGAFIIKFGPSLGPLLGGIGLCLAATAAWVTYAFFYRRTRDAAWIERYRVLYSEFWKESTIAEVRGWITSEIEYKDIQKILKERLGSGDKNYLQPDQNKKLEKIDQFCSLLVRIEYFYRATMTRRQRKLWKVTFGNYWVKKVVEREELRQYIEKYWPNMLI